MLLVAESKTSPFQKPQIAAEDEIPTRPTDAALETGPHAKVPDQLAYLYLHSTNKLLIK